MKITASLFVLMLTLSVSVMGQLRGASGSLGIYKGLIDSLLPKQVGTYTLGKTTYGPTMGAEAVARGSYTSNRSEYLELSVVNYADLSGPRNDFALLRKRASEMECVLTGPENKSLNGRTVGERYTIDCPKDGTVFVYWSNGSVMVRLESGNPKPKTKLVRSGLNKLVEFENKLAY
ncbi:MAG: hypothetical protein IT174_00580 [Acidobacteria bacterium]|nr:hypothetical protein [Acidobacteriota bacterium]